MNKTLQRNAAARAANDTGGLLGCLVVFVALIIYFNGV